MSDKWLSAVSNEALGINTFIQCIGLTDLYGDGDYKLIVGDIGNGRYNMKLKIFKDLILIRENVLTEIPSAILSIINEATQPNLPLIAVSCVSSILMYKNLKPFYKFNVPLLDVDRSESELWLSASAGKTDSSHLYTALTKLREKIGMSGISSLSQNFLRSSNAERNSLIVKYQNEKLQTRTIITCMTTLKKSSSNPSSIDCIVAGTECGIVFCIDSQAFTVLTKWTVNGIPSLLCATGVYDVDYRILVTCRESEVYSIKRNKSVLDVPLFIMDSNIIGVVRLVKQIIVACADCTVTFFTTKGKYQDRLKLDSHIKGMDIFSYMPRQYNALLIALPNEVRIYQNLTMVDSIKIDASIKWIRYGKLGRAEGALIIGAESGGVLVKLFKRTGILNENLKLSTGSFTQNRKFNIPKRTKIFVEQAMRERETAQMMHQVFQRDLFMLQLTVAKTFAKLAQNSLIPLTSTKNETVDISVEVNGFGPKFNMIVKIRAICSQPLEDRWLILYYNSGLYSFENSIFAIPALTSGNSYTFSTKIRRTEPEKAINDDVKVLFVSKSRINAAALIKMPVSETDIL